MRDKDSQLLSEAYAKIYNEELDPNSFSSAAVHLAVPALILLYKYLKGHFFTNPKAAVIVKQLFNDPEVSKDINAYLVLPNVHNLDTMRGAISEKAPAELVDEVIRQIREHLRHKQGESHV